MKPITVKYAKLKRNKAWGLAFTETNEIVIDSRLKGEDLLYTLIHEIIHCQNPKWGEHKVIGHSTQLSDILWSEFQKQIGLKEYNSPRRVKG